mmetsp:Transcript_23220/g.69553  ORF Transcript_23220/g.69553 Transcript_23220/m.69553 type:complete len:298 (+) Transcript_23220:230-1123(+)
MAAVAGAADAGAPPEPDDEAEEPTLNDNPDVVEVARVREVVYLPEEDPPGRDPFTAEEIFDHIRDIKDPEHEEMTLEQLSVVKVADVAVDDENATVEVRYTPTIPHCSMATLIGLCLSVKLIRSLPDRFKLLVAIAPGTHASEAEINKQLADKERVAAALENPHLLKVVNKCIYDPDAPEPLFAHDREHYINAHLFRQEDQKPWPFDETPIGEVRPMDFGLDRWGPEGPFDDAAVRRWIDEMLESCGGDEELMKERCLEILYERAENPPPPTPHPQIWPPPAGSWRAKAIYDTPGCD